jgi:hypothetical protein
LENPWRLAWKDEEDEGREKKERLSLSGMDFSELVSPSGFVF